MSDVPAGASDNPIDWPVEDAILWIKAYKGLLDGDALPLAEYIRRGLPVAGEIADMIACAIDGGEPMSDLTKRSDYRFVLKGKAGQKPHSHKVDSIVRKYKIGEFLQQKLAHGVKGGFDSYVLEAMEKFGRSRTVVLDSYRHYLIDLDRVTGEINAFIYRDDE